MKKHPFGCFSNRRQSQNDFADEGDSLRTAHFVRLWRTKIHSLRAKCFPEVHTAGKNGFEFVSGLRAENDDGFVCRLLWYFPPACAIIALVELLASTAGDRAFFVSDVTRQASASAVCASPAFCILIYRRPRNNAPWFGEIRIRGRLLSLFSLCCASNSAYLFFFVLLCHCQESCAVPHVLIHGKVNEMASQ